MTQREGHAKGTVAQVAARPAVHAVSVSARPGPDLAPNWEEFFRALAPDKQHHLLELARSQGLLYAHQLPILRNGAAADSARSLIGKILAGETGQLEPIPAEMVEPLDTALDPVQREAVARALHGKDLLLIEGVPGSGKTRVVAEIISQAARRGERVLFVAPSTSPLDRALELLGEREMVCSVRYLEPGENVESLRQAIRALTLAEQIRVLSEQTVESARQMTQSRARDCERLRADEAAWDRFAELADGQHELDEQTRGLARLRDALPALVDREAAAFSEEHPAGRFGDALREWDRQRREALARLEAEMSELERTRAEKSRVIESLTLETKQLEPLLEAQSQARWWTPRYWQARHRGATPSRYDECESQLREAAGALERLDHEIADVAQRRAQTARDEEARRLAILASEIARRLDEQGGRETALNQERAHLESKWQGLVRDLAPESPPPREAARPAVESARSAWRLALERATQEESFARRWSEELTQQPRLLADRFPELVNVVAATTTSLARDPLLSQGPLGSRFDLLIVEGAEQVTESEFLAVARRARRWVLVGTKAVEAEEATEEVARELAPRRRGARANDSRIGGRLSFFQRLWRQLHFDPATLPSVWDQDKERLRCVLRPVSAEQRRHLEVERVADSTEIELSILTESGKPSLVEVAFPPTMSISDAKRYIYHELQELALHAAGPQLAWIEEPQRLILQFGELADPGAIPVLVEEGVRELVGRAAAVNGSVAQGRWYTCRVEFDRAAGWHRQRAQEWLARHAGLRDSGRTISLTTHYRMHPDLAQFAADLKLPVGSPLVVPDEKLSPALTLDSRTARVEFIPVPALIRDRGTRHRDRGRPSDIATMLAQMKGGGGLELSLDDPKHRDRIPSEIRAKLPAQGLVNFLEAEAVARTVVQMARNKAFVDALAHTAAAAGTTPTVAVLALYPAQADLIRQLVRMTPELAGARFHLDVDVPEAYSQREALVVLLSLTRSNTHRAVTFGEDPDTLALALTRARDRLILFGDPGTLVRRTQWEGPLDHLDAAAANRERTCLSFLIRYLQGQGPHPRVFHLREGNSA